MLKFVMQSMKAGRKLVLLKLNPNSKLHSTLYRGGPDALTPPGHARLDRR
jgi:hypothetical protein